MKNDIVNGLSKVASETKAINLDMSKDLDMMAQHVASTFSDDELDEVVGPVEKQASQKKEAKLIEDGDIVICVDNYSPLFKGRRYLVADARIPGYLCIKEETGEDIGIFAVNRFVLDNNEQ